MFKSTRCVNKENIQKSSCSYYAALDAVLFIQETHTHATLLALEREI